MLRKEDKKTEEIMVVITTLALLILSIITFSQLLPESFSEITGEVVTRVNISRPPPSNCNFTLESGLNLISFFCIPNYISREDVVGEINTLTAIFEYQEGETDAWKSYNPELPDYVIHDLNSMSREEGYWIRMSSSEHYFLNGSLIIPTTIDLYPGWNLVGYSKDQAEETNQSLASIYGNYTEIRTYIESTGSYISYVPGTGGALNQTEPYKGYWINATTTEEWVIN